MAEPVPASETDTDNTDVARFYTEKANGGFRAIAEARVAHSANMTVADKGKTFQVNSSGEVGTLAPGSVGDLFRVSSGGLPEWFTPTYATLAGTETLSNKKLVDSSVSFVDDGDNTKQFKVQVSGITTGTTRTMTLPDYDFTVASLAGTETFTNKSLSDSTTYVIDNADTTKKFQFQVSGITTATTRTYAAPDKDGTLALTRDVGLYLIEAVPFTSVTTVTIDDLPSTDCDEILFVFSIMSEASGVSSLTAQFSKNNGSSWITTNYSYTNIRCGNAVALTGAASTGQSAWNVGLSGGSSSDFVCSGEFRLFTPTKSRIAGGNQAAARASWDFYGADGNFGQQLYSHGFGESLTSDADLNRPNAIRFTGSTMTGSIYVYGLRNAS